MKLNGIFTLLIFLLLSLLAFSCGSNEDVNTDGDEIESEMESDGDDTESEIEDDAIDGDDMETDLESDGDTDGDIEETEEDIVEAFTPHEPASISPELVLQDTPYMQEFNHTIPEIPEGVGELVAMVMPPATYTDFESPTMIAPRGYWIAAAKTEVLSLQEIPIDAEDIMDAEATTDAIYLLTSKELYKVTSDKNAASVGTLPDGATPHRLYTHGANIFVLTTTGIGVYTGSGDVTWHSMSSGPTAMHINDTYMIMAWADRMAGFEPTATPDSSDAIWFHEIGSLNLGTPVAVLQNRTLPQALDIVIVGSDKLAGFSIRDAVVAQVDIPLFEEGRVPLTGAVTAIEDRNGGFVVAANGGAYRIIYEDEAIGFEYRVYVPDRWMPSGDVRDIVMDTSSDTGSLYFATKKGPGSMTRKMYTLSEKMDSIVERIKLRHDRDGAVADSRLTIPGDLSTSVPYDSDNDGGWTCYWVLSECFRHKLTGAADAKANFDKSLARMLSFRTLTGTEYFLARSVIRIDGCQLDDCDDPDDGEWFKSPDGEWWVKADTSNDEVTSHMFMMGHAYDYCADEDQKQAIVEHVDGIINGIVENGYQLVDPQDGECTTYGQFDPLYMQLVGFLSDGGRRAAQIIGALNFAYYLTGKEKYMDAKKDLIENHGYAELIEALGDIEHYPFCGGNPDCDELAMQAYFPLLRYEQDEELRNRWMTGWNRLYTHLVTQEDAYWEFANTYFEGESIDLTYSKRWLKRYPTDMVRWTVRNSEVRQDTIAAPDYYLVRDDNPNYKLRSDGHTFGADERRLTRHNATQFDFSGGNGGLRELDGGSALFTYWLGRFYGYLTEAQ